MADWISVNTTLSKRRFTFDDYQFQRAIADDMHPDMSVEKCSQVGLTEIQIRKFLAMLTRHNGTAGIFTLPNEKMFTRIYNARIKPIIDADAVFNPELGIKPIRRRDMVQIRDSFGYVTGCTEGDATSISADFIMHDEYDLSPQDILALYQSRVQNSEMRVTQRFSTPSFLGFGINRQYGMTDQREYMIKCSSCNHWQTPRFEPKFIHIENFPFEVGDYHELATEQIVSLDLEGSYVRCEQCSSRLDLGDSSAREWVPTYPGRTASRGYKVRPFSTSRLPPSYVFGQLAKYLEDGYLRGFYNTVLGEAFADGSAQVQRTDVEQCMRTANIETVAQGTPCYLGIDVGFTCHITVSFDDEAGLPHYCLFESVPIAHLESRIAELRKIYTIVQGCIDRFPYTTVADTLREATGGIIMPAQYRGNVSMVAQKDELGIITHYSVNNTLLFDRLHAAISNHKMVLSGYTNQRETLIAHMTDMFRDEQPEAETIWKKNSGNDHFFHSMAFNQLARRISEHLFHTGSSAPQVCSTVVSGASPSTGVSLTPGNGASRISRLGAR